MQKWLKKEFLPKDYVQENFTRFHRLVQGSDSVEEYARKFESFLIKCELNEDEPPTLIRFLGGLDTKIANVVELHDFTTLDQLVQLAYKVERQLKSKGKGETSRTLSTNRPFQPRNRQFPTSYPLTLRPGEK